MAPPINRFPTWEKLQMQQGSTYQLSERQAFFGQALLNMHVSVNERSLKSPVFWPILSYQIQVKPLQLQKLDRSKSYRRSKQAKQFHEEYGNESI